MVIFRFLVISDLHISVTPRRIGLADVFFANPKYFARISFTSSHDPDLLDGLAGFAGRICDNIDAILIPGDLATTGYRPDLVAAHDFVAGRSNPSLPNITKFLLSGKATLAGRQRF